MVPSQSRMQWTGWPRLKRRFVDRDIVARDEAQKVSGRALQQLHSDQTVVCSRRHDRRLPGEIRKATHSCSSVDSRPGYWSRRHGRGAGVCDAVIAPAGGKWRTRQGATTGQVTFTGQTPWQTLPTRALALSLSRALSRSLCVYSCVCVHTRNGFAQQCRPLRLVTSQWQWRY